MRPDTGREAGFVLPAVLAVMVAVAAVALSATQLLRTRIAVAAGRSDGLRLQGFADGVARLVSVSLLAERTRQVPGLGLPEDGSPVACPLPGGGRIEVAVEDQAGLIDLNASPRPLLESAFRALGLPDRDAATIAAEVVDYRDPDDTPEPMGGAEAPQYKARGLPYGPRNAPFASIDELDLLPSVTGDIAAVLRRATTVWNPGGGIDPTLGLGRTLTRSVAAEDLRSYLRPSPRRSFEIRVLAETATGSRSGRAVVLSTDARGAGTGLFAWHAYTASSPAAPTHRACTAILAALDPA